MDNRFFQKLGVPLKFQKTIDNNSHKLYDKGENIYINLDGSLQVDDLIFDKGTILTQLGNPYPQFITIAKESFNNRVLCIKVHTFLHSIPAEIKADFQFLYQITRNKELYVYQKYPALLFPWMQRMTVWPHQEINLEDCFIYIAQGLVMQNQNLIQSSFTGKAVAQTECRIYFLKKTEVQNLKWFAMTDVVVQQRINEYSVKTGFVSFDTPQYPQTTVIKDIKHIKELIQGDDFNQLKQKMNEVFGKSKKKNQQKVRSISNHMQTQISRRVQTPSQKYSQEDKQKITFKKVIVRRSVQRVYDEQVYYQENLATSPQSHPTQRVSRRNKSLIHQKTDTSQNKAQCLPIIRSYMQENFEDDKLFMATNNILRKKRNEHKFLEFQKLLNIQLNLSD